MTLQTEVPLKVLRTNYQDCVAYSKSDGFYLNNKYRTREIYKMHPSLFNKESLVSLTEIKNIEKKRKEIKTQGIFKYFDWE